MSVLVKCVRDFCIWSQDHCAPILFGVFLFLRISAFDDTKCTPFSLQNFSDFVDFITNSNQGRHTTTTYFGVIVTINRHYFFFFFFLNSKQHFRKIFRSTRYFYIDKMTPFQRLIICWLCSFLLIAVIPDAKPHHNLYVHKQSNRRLWAEKLGLNDLPSTNAVGLKVTLSVFYLNQHLEK